MSLFEDLFEYDKPPRPWTDVRPPRNGYEEVEIGSIWDLETLQSVIFGRWEPGVDPANLTQNAQGPIESTDAWQLYLRQCEESHMEPVFKTTQFTPKHICVAQCFHRRLEIKGSLKNWHETVDIWRRKDSWFARKFYSPNPWDWRISAEQVELEIESRHYVEEVCH
jgi:hypothetical protein